MEKYDVIIIGAGPAGLMAANVLAKRGKTAIILDMGKLSARKVAISGGGKCNFTNMRADYTRYYGKNPRFVTSALTQFSPRDTLAWARAHDIKYVEKEPGRYFCKNSATDVIRALLHDIGDIRIKYKTNVMDVEKSDDGFRVITTNGDFYSKSVIVASGGQSYPHLGVSLIGKRIAKVFGHNVEKMKPALCGIKTNCFSPELAGVSLPVEIEVAGHKIKDSLLFTHIGIGGPAVYRASLLSTNQMIINFVPGRNAFDLLKYKKQHDGKKIVYNAAADFLPSNLARVLCDGFKRNIADLKDTELHYIASKINHRIVMNASAAGFDSAEVTIGGVSTDQISSKTMESKLCPGLYFAGEVLDVTGDLGGFNIQWAFSSGFVAGTNA